MDLIQEGREKEREGGVEERRERWEVGGERRGVERGRDMDMHCVVLNMCVYTCVCCCMFALEPGFVLYSPSL